MRTIPQEAVDFVAKHEGVVLKAYLDSANMWTIGFGHIDGVKAGDRCTRSQALKWLGEDMQIAVRKLYGVLKSDVIDDLTPSIWAALLSFTFNLGAGPKWQIWKLLNNRQYDLAADQLTRFINAGGRKVQGLVARRADEFALWHRDDETAGQEAPPSAITRGVGVTPPTPSDPVPAGKSLTLISGGVGAATTVTVAAKTVSDTLEPYKDAAPLIGQVIAAIACVAAAAAVLVLALNWLRKHQERRT